MKTALQKRRAKDLNDAKRILERCVEELGVYENGWGVDILCAAISHLISYSTHVPEIFNGFSTVQRWDSGELRIIDQKAVNKVLLM